MGPGGSRGLQNRCGAAFVVPGGFDSLALPPPILILNSPVSARLPIAVVAQNSSFDSNRDSNPHGRTWTCMESSGLSPKGEPVPGVDLIRGHKHKQEDERDAELDHLAAGESNASIATAASRCIVGVT